MRTRSLETRSLVLLLRSMFYGSPNHGSAWLRRPLLLECALISGYVGKERTHVVTTTQHLTTSSNEMVTGDLRFDYDPKHEEAEHLPKHVRSAIRSDETVHSSWARDVVDLAYKVPTLGCAAVCVAIECGRQQRWQLAARLGRRWCGSCERDTHTTDSWKLWMTVWPTSNLTRCPADCTKTS